MRETDVYPYYSVSSFKLLTIFQHLVAMATDRDTVFLDDKDMQYSKTKRKDSYLHFLMSISYFSTILDLEHTHALHTRGTDYFLLSHQLGLLYSADDQ